LITTDEVAGAVALKIAHDQSLVRRMKIDRRQHATGLKNRASSPGSPADADNEFASFAAQLAARAERLRAGAVPASPPSGPSRAPAPGIDRGEPTSLFAPSSLAADYAGHFLGGCLLLALLASLAVMAVWGLPFQPAKPLPPNRIEQAKASVAGADTVEKAPPPVARPVSLAPAPQEAGKSTPERPPEPSRSPAPSVMPADPAPLTGSEIRELQSRLKAAGFSPGPIDGAVGPMTQNALRKYAQSRALPDAEATRELLARLRTELPPKRN
jgi:hypothetical protein